MPGKIHGDAGLTQRSTLRTTLPLGRRQSRFPPMSITLSRGLWSCFLREFDITQRTIYSTTHNATTGRSNGLWRAFPATSFKDSLLRMGRVMKFLSQEIENVFKAKNIFRRGLAKSFMRIQHCLCLRRFLLLRDGAARVCSEGLQSGGLNLT
jgi:hypothetical protein